MLTPRLISELGGLRSNLRAVVHRSGLAVIVSAGGEADACNESTWRQLIQEAASVTSAPGTVVVDLTGLDFVSCCAFQALTEESERCRRRGIDMRLVSQRGMVTRIVKACGFADMLPVYPTVDSALDTEPAVA
ncbi:anti-sigma factor antagonist [Mycobacterium parmense]|nr:anti-sigma factor antagonist [Mycobacterium parmense]MCV7353255.1 anti-sigma factor antagonist [Mycobacterium parmense]ORW61565.1 anti-anti-sigma factor [Mycobacterium parmense]